MDKIQLIFFFVSGFLVSRLIIKARLPQRLVYWFIGKRHLSLAAILFYIIAITALLSFFIPNAITVLTLLPLLELIRRTYEKTAKPPKSIATMLALAAIYGANIGGMGSVTATPANGILVTYAVLNDVAGIRYLSFASWLMWGIPLVAIFILIAWLILIGVLRPWKYHESGIQLPFSDAEVSHPYQKITIGLTAFYFLSSFFLSLLMMYASGHTITVLMITAVLTMLLLVFLFLVPLKNREEDQPREVLLRIADCYNELPTKGFIFVGIAVALAAVLYGLNIHEYFSRWAGRILPGGVPLFVLFFFIALVTSFSTEVLSNTAVQLAFFVIALPVSQTMGFSALEA